MTKTTCTLLLAALVLMALAVGCDDKEYYLQLQSDVVRLEGDVRTLRSRFDENATNLNELILQMRNRMQTANTNLARLDEQLQNSLREREEKAGVPLKRLDAKLSEMNTSSADLKNAIADLNSRLQELERQLSAIEETVTSMPRPPATGDNLAETDHRL